MDQSGFDGLAKALSNSASSRRRVLQLAAATLVGAPLLTLFPSSAAGGAKKRCKKRSTPGTTSPAVNVSAPSLGARGNTRTGNFHARQMRTVLATKPPTGAAFARGRCA